MMVYYNDIDPYCVQWLRNLIAAGHLPAGDVDERSIADVRSDDLQGYVQCHFFAGIGGWPYALHLAGWPDDRQVWTGSCPCQPFSAAGRAGGFDDGRHLWPHWARLIDECRPECLFGEQVSSPDGLAWLDFVCADLEATGYTVGAIDSCAASVGAPHIRQRLWFVGQSAGTGSLAGREAAAAMGHGSSFEPAGCSDRLANGLGARLEVVGKQPAWQECAPAERSSPTNGFWRDIEWLPCTDGKSRPVEPGTFPLASRVPARVGKLRAYGNAIVPQVAAEFIKAYREVLGEDLHGL